MKNKILFLTFFILLLHNVKAQKIEPNYSFFVAGHTYGNPMSPQYGLHAPFVDYIPKINNYTNMQFGVLTGDVVVSSTAEYWDTAQIDINKLNMPIYIAAGNHDIGQEFINRFEKYYFSFIQNNDLFIVLTPSLDHWNISGKQLAFLENTLDSNYNSVNNIFIFLHELIWWSPDNIYKNIEINYSPTYPGITNFDTIVKPLLLSYPNNITLYAGDLGCTKKVSSFMYHKFDNITLIASGMGGGIEDNIIITNVYNDSVYYDLVAINGDDPNSLGELNHYNINSIEHEKDISDINIYPNPCKNYFFVENNMQSNFNMKLFNLSGKLIIEKILNKNSKEQFKFSKIKSGIYILQLYNEKYCFMRKIIKK